MASIEHKYNMLKEKYGLPDYALLNNNFMVEDIEPETNLILAKIRQKIHEKIEFYTKILESLLQPDSNLASLYEIRYMTDKEREKVYSLFKKLVRIIRNSNHIAIDNDEEETADFIKTVYQDWQELKQELKKLIKKVESLWKKETDIKSDYSYFG